MLLRLLKTLLLRVVFTLKLSTMLITFILALIGVFGTLTIVAYLRQVEDEMPNLLEKLDAPECPVCHLPHHNESHPQSRQQVQRGFRKIKGYYHRKKTAAAGYCSRSKKS